MLYLEVPADTEVADQLIGLMDADLAGEPLWPPPSLRILVCVISGLDGMQEHAIIIEHETSYTKMSYAGDARYKTWLWIPLGRVLEQHPTLPIAQASPQTQMKLARR